MTRNSYIAAIAVTIVFAALLATSLPGHDWLSASLHAIADFKVMWLCVLIAAWQILSAPGRPLQQSDVVIGGGLAALSAVTAGLWPWLFLIAFLGYGRQLLSFTNRFLRYTAEASYPAYILHQTVIVIVGFNVVQWEAGVPVKFLTILVAALVITTLIYDLLVMRTNLTRFLFGMRLKKTQVEEPTPRPRTA